MTRLKPNFSILPESQREVWKRLGATPGNFVLGVAIASLVDLFGMKCATVPQRNEVNDYRDIHASAE